ncbi:MAG: tetratricopeptide repeat protein [Lachnospiraceae bacterium]|nr:tetratricopeptide repeat protein [Lachnospiraceae bacterium]
MNKSGKKRFLIRMLLGVFIMGMLGGLGTGILYFYNTSKEKKEFRQQGLDAYSAGSYEEAIEAFRVSLDSKGYLQGPVDRDSRLYLADCYFLCGRYEEAMEQYDILLKTEVEHIDYLIYQKTIAQGLLNYENDNYKDALPAFETALNAGHTEIAIYAGICAQNLGRESEMVSYYTIYLTNYPDSAYACTKLADYYLQDENYETCKKYIDLGLSMDDTSCDEALSWLNIVYYEYQLDYDQAYRLIKDYMSRYDVTDQVQREYDFLSTRQTTDALTSLVQ